MTHDEVSIRFYQSPVEGNVEIAVNFPDNIDQDNLRAFEMAAMVVLNFIEEQSDEFESVAEN